MHSCVSIASSIWANRYIERGSIGGFIDDQQKELDKKKGDLISLVEKGNVELPKARTEAQSRRGRDAPAVV